ncbi:regulator of chromosome condensation 1/beta-lactamase-inhibitor protein II [Piptocephalis cylindrospora]|uniref:Regulator of chromosome condensation 1/beta-lactamase-inhibitor protein II n=1 Tax=Piptocephalis cylindrospora TaxID=1907219 RepID=A0A4P9Y5E7_9FUNG|nr:regulator of chromosome condensation 1/beta-lactamase-inhibitor protein II [Piptocephalis cylindrospora]|eukprot:RKP13010.1 regulator of chromosome condensation 1/beta-lactamase-inhibitor protein II [Piptocephalis cylindrospora]
MSETVYACGFNGFQQLLPEGPPVLERLSRLPGVDRILDSTWSGLEYANSDMCQHRGYSSSARTHRYIWKTDEIRMTYASGRGVHLMDGSVWEVRGERWTQIAGEVYAGHSHFLALTLDGEVYAWGDTRFGQLGLDRPIGTEAITHPEVITALQGLRMLDIACGSFHSVVLAETGDIYTFGWNKHGQLGLGDTQDPEVDLGGPQLVNFPAGGEVNVQSIACGTHHTVVLDDAHRVWATGWGKWGQCGEKRSQSTFHPLLLPSTASAGALHIRCGPWCTFVRVSDKQKGE